MLWIFIVTLATAVDAETESSVLDSYLGFGYDLVLGNPVYLHPGQLGDGSQDPGLTASRVLKSVRSRVADSGPGEVRCEKKAEYVLTPADFRSRVVDDMVSYTEDGGSTVSNFAISGSKDARDSFPPETLLLEKYRTCTDSLPHSLTEPEVTDYFMYRVCTLPEPAENADMYNQFITEFRTSVIMSVELGHVEVTRYSAVYSQIPKLIQQLQESDPILYRNSQGRISRMYINITEATLAALDKSEFQQRASVERAWRVGNTDSPGVVRMSVADVGQVLDEKYFSVCRGDKANQFWNGYDGCCARLPQLKTRVQAALGRYPDRLGIPTHAAVTDSYYRVYWPRGTYSLVRTADGCPARTGFRLEHGTVTHTQGYKITEASVRILPAIFGQSIVGGQRYRSYMADVVNQQFCTKTETDNAREGEWPRGSYCINKYGDCPSGFNDGWIWFDDIHLKNENSHNGVVPEGIYDRDTQFYYCCRSDGAATSPVILPLHHPFILMRHGGTCQAVRWARLEQASVFFDASWGTSAYPSSHFMGGEHPDNAMSGSNNKLFFCYYTFNHPAEPNQ